ncbi:hypothetical protein [Streptomyces sp. WG5]|uniref:hypothetical protein n=1 Tax=Streptomyces sp. WG5 TaxID=3417648 RepID=UPI003CF46052
MSETAAAVRAEFTKLLGIRGTLAALLLFAPFSLLIAALGGWSAKGAIESDSPGLRPDFTPQQAGLDGVLYGQLALIVFGVLIVSSEYTSGMMRVSLLAVPRRGRLYAAKTAVTAAATAVSRSPSRSPATWSPSSPSDPTAPRSARAVSLAPWPARCST